MGQQKMFQHILPLQTVQADLKGNTFHTCINHLPYGKFLGFSKLKALADNKINVTQKQKHFLKWVENIVEKGENAGYQHFLLFPQCFLKLFFQGRK